MIPDIPTWGAAAAIAIGLCCLAAWLIDGPRRAPLIGLLFPQRGRHLVREPELVDVTGDGYPGEQAEAQRQRRWPMPGDKEENADDPSVPGTGMRDADPVREAGVQPPLVPDPEGVPDRRVEDVEERCGSGQPSAPGSDAAGDRQHDAADDDLTGLSAEDTDTLKAIRAINAEHLVPTNEPEPPATDHAATPPAADGGDAPGPAEWDAVSGASGPTSGRPPAGPGAPTSLGGVILFSRFLTRRAGQGRQVRTGATALGEPGAVSAQSSPSPAPDTLDRLAAAYQADPDATITDPAFPQWVRDALGCDSVAAYMDQMSRALRAVTTGA